MNAFRLDGLDTEDNLPDDFSDAAASDSAEKNYCGYVKFFAGLVFAVALLQPLISMISDENWEETVISRMTELEESIGTDARIDLSEMEKRQQELLEEYAVEATESDESVMEESEAKDSESEK